MLDNRIKIRNIWYYIIRDDIHHLKSLLVQTKFSLEKTENSFHEVLHRYPNIHFVYNLYSKFVLQILINPVKFKKIQNQLQNLHFGQIVVQNNAQYFGMPVFSQLNCSHQENAVKIEIGSSPPLEEQTDIFDEVLMNQYLNFKTSIKHISFPGIKFYQTSSLLLFIF
jgi:hypothetical protein